MEQKHKDIIKRNMEKLVENTSDICLEMLVDYLVRDRIFTDEMAKRYKDPNESVISRKLNFYLDVQTRGPRAFDRLVNALREASAKDLVALLMPSSARRNTYPAASSGSQPHTFPAYMMEDNRNLMRNLSTLAREHPGAIVNFSQQPILVKVKPATVRHDLAIEDGIRLPHYQMGTRPKGLALIINIWRFEGNVHPLREGADVDSKNLMELFTQLGYETELHEDLNRADFLDILRRFSQRPEHMKLSSCIVCVMSHGSMPNASNTDLSTIIYTSDGLTIKYMDIVEKFDSNNCPGLIHKPKVFFFQSCRGSERNHRVQFVANSRTQVDGIPNVPIRSLSDIIIGHATPRGYEAIRDKYTGSWFIQTLVKVFMDHACDTEVGLMLKMVDHKMRVLVSEQNGLQTTCIEDIGFKQMYISPGLYDDDQEVPDSGAVSTSETDQENSVPH